MSTYKEKIEGDLKAAMKGREELRVSVLRMISSAIHNREIEKRGRTGDAQLTEEEVIAVLRGEAKKRKEAAGEFEKGKRPELAEKERQEAKIIESYLPAEMPDEEIEKMVRSIIAESGEVTQKDFGRIMGEVMKRLRGQASGERVSVAVKKFLQ